MKIVERGAEFLDEREPGWAEKIDPDTLDLGDGCNCVLGQLWRREHSRSTRPYERKAYELGIDPYDWRSAGRLGFVEYGRAQFANMTAAWRHEIQKRRKS